MTETAKACSQQEPEEAGRTVPVASDSGHSPADTWVLDLNLLNCERFFSLRFVMAVPGN